MKEIVEKLDAKTLKLAITALGLPCTDKRRLTALRAAFSRTVPSLEVFDALGIRLPESTLTQTSARLATSTSIQNAKPIFVALDFETANRSRDSACAVSVVRVEDGHIVNTYTKLIRPPVLDFEFTYIHGISARDVKNAPTYKEIHQEILEQMSGAEFIAAHNASFDLSVMNAVCRRWNLTPPSLPWQCTVKISRSKWNIYPTKLPDVCNHLAIPLKHHDATSDATACARIVLAAKS